MGRLRIVLWVLLVLAWTAVSPAPRAQACSCAERPTAQLLEDADVVVVGTPREGTDLDRNAYASVAHPIEVTRVFKGTAHDRTLMWGPSEGNSCGPLPTDEPMVLMGSREGDDLAVGLCQGAYPATTEAVARVAAASDADGEVPQAGTDPALIRIEDDLAADQRIRWLAAGGVGLLLGVGGGFLLMRRRRNPAR